MRVGSEWDAAPERAPPPTMALPRALLPPALFALAPFLVALAPHAPAQGITPGPLAPAFPAERVGAPVPGGRFVNFETPQVHPIEVASVAGRDYVLVCNTPDNSVEIHQAAPPHAFVQRVPVGLGPVSVRWSAALQRFYVCNFDGDSISVVRLQPFGNSVHAVLERTTSEGVGDEPADIAFDPTHTVAAVTLSSSSALVRLDPLTLAPLGAPQRLQLDGAALGFARDLAVKMPRALAWLPDGRLFVANLRAGSPRPGGGAQVDLGLYRDDPYRVPAGPDPIGGLGSTVHAFAFSPDRELVFVVGTRARNHDAAGVAAVSQLPTGFVQSWLTVIEVTPGGDPTVRPEAVAGGPTPHALPSIDLNRDYASPGIVPVRSDEALAQPTDVLVLRGPGGSVGRIALTAFHSDRVALLRPDAGLPGGYEIRRVDVPPLAHGGYTTSGPRGLAYSARESLLFVHGRLDNSLAVIDVASATLLARLPLRNDPTPPEIRAGRQFLYGARFSIDVSQTPPTGGFVSCASCHIDARTDGLPWDLGDLASSNSLPEGFHDPDPLGFVTVVNAMPSQKGPLVTQTLQGLLNSRVNEDFEFAVTNAPYHWRGDKADFTDFNEAFVNLQRMRDIGGPGDPKGLTDEEMIAYRRFVNTIQHPPNPEQHLERITPGALGADPNDPSQASGAKLGMQLFHNVQSGGARSCVQCHTLPEGSSNTATDDFLVHPTLAGGPGVRHPFESAGLRGIAQREMVLHEDFSRVITAITADSGLLHPGDPTLLNSSSINNFVTATFRSFMPDPVAPTQIRAVVEFVRQLDTGTAPVVGRAYTVDPSLAPLDSGTNRERFELFEGQVAEANCGLAVHARSGGVERGFWYDLLANPPAYREEGTANLLSRAQILALAFGPDAVVIAQATPLGNERRIAALSGVATPLTGAAAPSAIVLEAMAPNSAYVDVPRFTGNLLPNALPYSSVWSLRRLQDSVIGQFGVPGPRHEPPRRFRISGEHLRPGARLALGIAAGNAPTQGPLEILVAELYPTERFVEGRRIWETEVELDAAQTYALLNGGHWAPSVTDVLLRRTTSPTLQPLAWNHYWVAVSNEDGTFGAAPSWQPLTIRDSR